MQNVLYLKYFKGGIIIELSERQEQIIEIVKQHGPISGDDIANHLNVSRAALRADLAVLTMAGFLDARPRVGYFYSGKTMTSLFAEKIQKIKVKEVKSLPIIINSGQSIYEAIVMIFMEDVGTIFVVNDSNYLEGVISRKDLLKHALGQANLEKLPVSIAMTRMPNVKVTEPEESVWEAARKMTEYEVDSLPVVRKVMLDDRNSAYQIVGRITKTIITRLFVDMGRA